MISALERRVDALRHELTARFGWTHLEVVLSLDEAARVVRVSGCVVVSRVGGKLRRELSAELPAGWKVDLDSVRVMAGTEHRSLLARVTELWQKPGGALSTELAIDDGPVEVMVRVGDATLVRALDGTLGWVERALGARVPVPNIEACRPRWDALEPTLVRFLGAPYKLGGTLAGGVDCSGLVQRAYRASQRILFPRHSTDQLRMALDVALSTRPASDRKTGDLVFTWTEREGPCHVGAIVVGEDRVVIHASLSRRAVVRDPLTRFVEGARRVEYVSRSAIEELGRQNAGKPGLELPSPEGT
jgi:hypothetical protein